MSMAGAVVPRRRTVVRLEQWRERGGGCGPQMADCGPPGAVA
ncbi:MAG: hypothetical protein ACUVR2_10940 [Anaerolineae bacterium]